MDGREFMALLTYLQLVPEGVSKTFALDIFAKAKAKGAGKDKSELGQPNPTDDCHNDVCDICPLIVAAACPLIAATACQRLCCLCLCFRLARLARLRVGDATHLSSSRSRLRLPPHSGAPCTRIDSIPNIFVE